MLGIYLHIPFCRRKCLYCDFYSVGASLAEWQPFISALINEANTRLPNSSFLSPNSSFSPHSYLLSPNSSLYIGGGTPSLIPIPEFQRLARRLLDLAPGPCEFTIEVNPEDVTPDRVVAWRDAGVSRISMGVQCLDDNTLRAIGRRHTAADAIHAAQLLHHHFDNVSLDLMFGLPGQNLPKLMESVQGIIDLHPQHISAYSLMYEERTALTRLRDKGAVDPVDDMDCVEMFARLSEALVVAGYEQYEISNYALPGFRSRHNSLYWHGNPYVGIGPSAHSYDGCRTRTANLPNLKDYIDYWSNPVGTPPQEVEHLDDDQLREEYIMTRLRTREGIDLHDFKNRFGDTLCRNLIGDAQPFLVANSLLLSEDRHLSLSPSGIMISDEIISSLF